MAEVFELVKASSPDAAMEYWEPEGREGGGYSNVAMPDGLPFTKPPYGRINAINMDSGSRDFVVADVTASEIVRHSKICICPC
jgi:hypothetical protein